MFPFGYVPQSIEEKKVEKRVGPPIACIKRRENRSYCGREVNESQEYMFTDGPHAMKHYRDSKTIRVCPDCATECDASGVGEIKFMAPPATRGLENLK